MIAEKRKVFFLAQHALSQPTLWIANVWVQVVDNQSHQNDDNVPNNCGEKDLTAISEPQQQAVLQ